MESPGIRSGAWLAPVSDGHHGEGPGLLSGREGAAED